MAATWKERFSSSFLDQDDNPKDDMQPPKDDMQPFYLYLSTVEFPKIFVCVQQSGQGNDVLGNQDPGNLGNLALQHIDAKQGSPFKLSATGRPGWYMYMTDNDVKLCEEVINPDGHWKMQEIDPKKYKKQHHVNLSTVNSSGEPVYAYMEHTGDHYVLKCSTTKPCNNGVFIVHQPPNNSPKS